MEIREILCGNACLCVCGIVGLFLCVCGLCVCMCVCVCVCVCVCLCVACVCVRVGVVLYFIGSVSPALSAVRELSRQAVSIVWTDSEAFVKVGEKTKTIQTTSKHRQ